MFLQYYWILFYYIEGTMHACCTVLLTADWHSDICPVWTQLPWSSWGLNALLEVLMVVGWWTESITHSPFSHRHTGCLPVRGLELRRSGCLQSVGLCRMKRKKNVLWMSKGFLPNQHVHAHALQEVISCCCFHFAFSCWMFYSFPAMLIKLMKGETGIGLIMFYGSKTQWGLCLFARVFFSQLAEWLTLLGRGRASAADGDRYEAWEEHLWEFCSSGCQSHLPALISPSQHGHYHHQQILPC